ncbi:MAG: hypothetical protein H2039_03885 [Brevundimonas sp.]|jgi:YD repeat-containing protein|nr:hypothetical protein [Brevundimonas sp.]
MRYLGRGVVVASAVGLSAVVLCPAGAQAQVSTTYAYDALGRLKTVTNAGGATVTYAYDAAGNRSQVVVAGVQTAPSAFDLGAPVTGAAAGAWVLSASPVLSGFSGAAAISVSGGEYRIDGGSWRTAAGTVSAGQSVQVRVQAPTTAGASQTATLNVGGVTAAFQVTTAVAAADTTPDAYDLGNPVAAASGAWAASNTITVSGVNAATPVSISGGQYRINGGAWTTANGTVTAGQTIQVQVQAPATGGAGQTATLDVGGVTDTFQVTAAADATPDSYDLGGPATAASGAWAASNTITVSGVNAATPVSISGGQYRINGADWTTANGTITAGQTLQVQVQAPAAGGASQTATLNVGGVTDTFQVTAATDTTPDAATFQDITINSNDPDVGWIGTESLVTGINQPLVLRIERYSYSGDLDAAYIDYQVFDTSGTMVEGGYYDVRTGGLQYKDVTVQNGYRVKYFAHGITSSGRRSGAWNMTVWRMDGSGVKWSERNVNVTVDADNNHNVADYALDPIDWPNMAEASSSTNFVTGGPSLPLNGINRNVNLRATITGLSGDLSGGSRLEMWVNGALRYHSTNLGNGSWAGGDFAPGETVQFVARAVSADGAQRSGGYTVTVQNLTTGQTIDSFSVSQTAAAPDYTPDAFNDFTDQNGVTDAPTIWFGPAQTVTGINRPITLRVERYNYSGNLSEVYVNVYRDSGSGWVHQGYFDPRNTQGYQYVDVTVNNGDKIHYAIDARTSEGRRTGTMNMVVWNLSQPGGSVQLSNRTANITVDNDNNYPNRNVSAVDWDNGHFETNDNIGAGATSYRTIGGIEAPVTLRADLQNITGQGYNLADGGTFYIESATRGRLASTPWRNGGSVSAVVQPGEQIRFYTDAFTSQGRKQYGFDVQVYNATTGAHIDHHYQSGILDADNNWGYGASVTLARTNISGAAIVNRGKPVTARASTEFTVSGASGSWTAVVELQNLSGRTPTTSVSGTAASIRLTSAQTETTSGQFRLKVVDANNTVSYSPWGEFTLEIQGEGELILNQ